MSLYGVYRGRAAFDAEVVERPEKSPMVRARIAVSIAGPGARAEDGDELTDWVNIIAFSERTRRQLASVKRGDTVCVMGAVTASCYRTRDKKRRYSRTITAEGVMALPRGSEVTGADTADIAPEAKNALGSLADEMISRVDADEDPLLED